MKIIVTIMALMCAACAPVQPWEKGTLASSAMGFDGDRLGAKFDQHILTSREAASGGGGIGGGGCGCN